MTLADWHELLAGSAVCLIVLAVWLLFINHLHVLGLRDLEERLQADIARNEALVAEVRQRHQAMREAMALWNYGAFDEAMETLQAGGWDARVVKS